MNEEQWARALARERQARKQAETLLEQRSRQLYCANTELQARNVELEQVNRQLESAHLQLLQTEKLASIGQLAAGLAHEINNPIGFVLSNLATLETYGEALLQLIGRSEAMEAAAGRDPAWAAWRALCREVDLDYLKQDLPSLLSETRDGLARVRKIVENLLDFARTGGGEGWQAVNIEQALDNTLALVWGDIKYKADVIRDYAHVPEVECQPTLINQVFLNLLLNAGQAIAAHGTIALRTGIWDAGIWVDIEDSGCGIAPANLGRIFDPFFTTKPVGQGTGLGLALSYGIIQQHGGRIEVDSAPGQGSRFRVLLLGRHDQAPSADERHLT